MCVFIFILFYFHKMLAGRPNTKYLWSAVKVFITLFSINPVFIIPFFTINMPALHWTGTSSKMNWYFTVRVLLQVGKIRPNSRITNIFYGGHAKFLGWPMPTQVLPWYCHCTSELSLLLLCNINLLIFPFHILHSME